MSDEQGDESAVGDKPDVLEDRSLTEEEMAENIDAAETRILDLEHELRVAYKAIEGIRDCFKDPVTLDRVLEPLGLPCGHILDKRSVAEMNKHRKRAGTANTGSANEGRASKRQCPERCPFCQEKFPASTSIPTVTAVKNALEIAGEQCVRMRTLFGESGADPCCEGNSPSSPTPSELFPSVEPYGESSEPDDSVVAEEIFPSVEPYGESSAVPAEPEPEPDDDDVAEDRPWTRVEVRPGVIERRDSSGALRSTTVHVGGTGDHLDTFMMHIQSVLRDRAARRARREARRVQSAERVLRRESRRRLDPFAPDSDDTDDGSSDSEINSDHDSDSDGNGSMDDE
jgi:hypothetical protein